LKDGKLLGREKVSQFCTRHKGCASSKAHPVMPSDIVFASRSAWWPFQPRLTSVRGALPTPLQSPQFPALFLSTSQAAELRPEEQQRQGVDLLSQWPPLASRPPRSGPGRRSHLPAKQPECSQPLFSRDPLNNTTPGWK